jgi:hypothetical protein
MIGIDKDDLIILVHTILVDPVRVQDTQVTATTANSLFRNAPQTALELEVIDTLMNRFTICRSCRKTLD